MKKLLLLMVAVGFAVFPSTALAVGQGCPTTDVIEVSTDQVLDAGCNVYAGVTGTPPGVAPAPATVLVDDPTTTTTAAVEGQVITQPDQQALSEPGNEPGNGGLPATGGDVLGLAAIGASLAAIGFGFTRARRRNAEQ